MRHVTMELGGKSPLIVFDDASLEDAVGAAILANFYSSGQICSNGTRVFVQQGILPAFLERLSARLASVKSGDPLDEATQHGPIVSPAQAGKIREAIARGRPRARGWSAAVRARAPLSRRRCLPMPRTRCSSCAKRSLARSCRC